MDELERVKRDLLRAEVRLAKARATVTTAEVDVKMLEARLRVLAK
jgi:outer membrane protein TolC